jgi:hypothetical protein
MLTVKALSPDKTDMGEADGLYDSAENRKAIHEEKTPEEERVKAYIPLRQKEKWLDRFRYVKPKDRVICPAKQLSSRKGATKGSTFSKSLIYLTNNVILFILFNML